MPLGIVPISKTIRRDCQSHREAHSTVRQAKVAAANILADIRGTGKKPYRFSNPFDTVSLGTTKAAFRYNDFYLFGPLGRFIWLAGYLLLMKGLYNRVRIFADGFLSAVFGRDITNVKIKPLGHS